MKKTILLCSLIFGSFVLVNGQKGRNPDPIPTPIVEDLHRQQGLDRQEDITNRSRELQMNENLPVGKSTDGKFFRENIKPIYREASKEELELVEPNNEDSTAFADFLQQKNTGLIKLIADKGCETNPKVVESPHCLQFSMPGNGSSYSFREKTYRVQRLGDLNFSGKYFDAVAMLTHGIFANLGDVSLDTVDMQNEAVKIAMGFKPAGDFAEAQKFVDELGKGIKKKDFVFQNRITVEENKTYLLRSIAYRGTVARTVSGISYNELEMDKREDVVVAFRVVRRDEDGSVTIAWKELSSKKAPKLEAKK